MSTKEHERNPSPNGVALQFKGVDYIELYVGNARQAAHFYRTGCGFTPTACAGLATDVRDRVSYVVEQGDIRLILTNALDPESPISEHVRLHGDSIKDIAFSVNDAEQAFAEALRRGARSVMEPTVLEDQSGQVIKATIGVYGDTVHSFIQRNGYAGAFLPSYQAIHDQPIESIGLEQIDHVAISIEPGKLNQWIEFYKDVLGFQQSHQEDVATDYSAMNSKVVQNSTGSIKLPMMEPALGKRKSQIAEYLEFHHGPGAQHLALLSSNIVRTVRALRANNIEFLATPGSYYDTLEARIGEIDEDMAALRDLNILVDRDEWGYLMQCFTKPIQDRPTVFLEIVQRKSARGFGSGNIRALFEALEREQELRGNL